MLWVEQPVGTGYTQGTPTATTQEETAQDFIGFFKNFQDTFGIQNFKIYVTGEVKQPKLYATSTLTGNRATREDMFLTFPQLCWIKMIHATMTSEVF